MENETFLKYGAVQQTLIHPIVLLSTLLVAFLILFAPRHKALVGLLAITLLVPMSQRIIIEGLNFMMVRVLIIFGLLRIFLRSGERADWRLNTLDKTVIAWAVIKAVVFTLNWKTGGALLNRMAFLYSSLGIYFIFRHLIADQASIRWVRTALMWLTLIIAVPMLLEQITGKNLFSFLGGIPEVTTIREGHFRSRGPFGHPILAGTFGAVILPLFLSSWWEERRLLLLVGCLSAVTIVLSSASSGPLIALAAGFIAFFAWPLHNHLRIICWSIVAMILGLHMVMKAPVWALIGRVSLIPGSTSYHRYQLVDLFIQKLPEWWLLGSRSYDEWGWMMWDTSNQFVQEGVDGGLLGLTLFIAVLAIAFRTLVRFIKDSGLSHPSSEWGLGASLVAVIVGFFGISYFDQMSVILFLFLALTSSHGDRSLNPSPEGTRTPASHTFI